MLHSRLSLSLILILLTLMICTTFASGETTTNRKSPGETTSQSQQSHVMNDSAFYQLYDVAFIAKVFRYLHQTFFDDFDPIVLSLFEEHAFLDATNQGRERWSFEELIGSWFRSSAPPETSQFGPASIKVTLVEHCLKKPPQIAKNVKRCFCQRNCSLEDSEIISGRLSRQIKAIYFAKNWNETAHDKKSRKQTTFNVLNTHEGTFVLERALIKGKAVNRGNVTLEKSPSSKEGVFCHQGFGCCYYFLRLVPSRIVEVFVDDAVELNGAFVFSNCTNTCTSTQTVIIEHSVLGSDPFAKDCIGQMYARRIMQQNIAERCELNSALQKHANIINRTISGKPKVKGIHVDVTGQIRNNELCSEDRQQALYLLAYSNIGLLSMSSFIMFHYVASCVNQHQCSPLWPAVSEHPLKLLHDRITTLANTSLAFDALAIVLNLIVILLLIRSTNALSNRAAKLLINICVASALFGVFDLVTGILNFHSGGLLNRTGVFANNDYLNLFCCDVDSTTIGVMYSFENSAVLYCSIVLQVLKTMCQFATLAFFVTYGIFQIVPLIRPFQSYSFLKQPKQMVVFVWALSLIVSMVVNLLPFLMYSSLRPLLKDSRQLDVELTTSENVLNASLIETTANSENAERLLIQEGFADLASERNLILLMSASLIDVCLSLFLLFACEMAYLSMVVTVVYIIHTRKKVISASNMQQQPTTISSNTRTIKSLVTMFISLSSLCFSSIPSHVLTIIVIMSSHYNFDQVAQRDLVGADTVSQFVSRYMRARIALLVEPILSPLLILIRYENLLGTRKNRAPSMFATSATYDRNSSSRSYSTATTIDSVNVSNKSSTC